MKGREVANRDSLLYYKMFKYHYIGRSLIFKDTALLNPLHKSTGEHDFLSD